MKAVSIVIKIVEIVILLAATGVVATFLKEWRDDLPSDDRAYELGGFGRYEFFLYTTSVGVIIAILSLVGLITGFVEKKGGSLAVAVLCLVWTLQLLVSAALLTKVLAELKDENGREKSLCDVFDDADKDYKCEELTGGVACGFIAVILFLADAVVGFMASRNNVA